MSRVVGDEERNEATGCSRAARGGVCLSPGEAMAPGLRTGRGQEERGETRGWRKGRRPRTTAIPGRKKRHELRGQNTRTAHVAQPVSQARKPAPRGAPTAQRHSARSRQRTDQNADVLPPAFSSPGPTARSRPSLRHCQSLGNSHWAPLPGAGPPRTSQAQSPPSSSWLSVREVRLHTDNQTQSNNW